MLFFSVVIIAAVSMLLLYKSRKRAASAPVFIYDSEDDRSLLSGAEVLRLLREKNRQHERR